MLRRTMPCLLPPADELSEVQSKAMDLDISLIDKKIDQMMPELGFAPEDNDRLVASFSGGWQMRMGLGKLLLQVRWGLLGALGQGGEQGWGW